jgi:protein-S-isoprenylcysteine O-methyltransferase Ste14
MRSQLKLLVGSGDRIGLLVLPFLIVALVLNIARPGWFTIGGPSDAVRAFAAIILVPGVIMWLWSVVLILTKVPRGELITTGPFALVKHPLYTSVAILVLPWVGFLLNTWLGALIGVVLYVASRRYAPAEEARLSEVFAGEWEEYRDRVRFPWI